MKSSLRSLAALVLVSLLASVASAQIGTRFPSEKKVVPDPVTGVPLTFLTSDGAGESKIYPTHRQWTADSQWIVYRSGRVRGQAVAVHEKTGERVQVTDQGFIGMLCLAQHSMKLYYFRPEGGVVPRDPNAPRGEGRSEQNRRPSQLVETDLAKLFADSAVGKVGPRENYERVVGTLPLAWGNGGDLALDAKEDVAYFRVAREEAAKHLPADVKPAENFGPRNMGAGPTGLGKIDLRTGEISFIIAVPFQVGHVQTNPWVTGEIVFCWETGGKSPQRMWTVNADGTGLRPLFPEQPFNWITHEAVITQDEVAFAIMGHRKPGTNDAWGPSGTREHPTGLGIVNLRTREMRIVGQTKRGSGLWHVHGSSDGRWAVGDDFGRNLYLIDRYNDEMILLSTGHKATAADHVHPTFSPDGTRIQIQSAMLAGDGRSMDICVVPVPDALLKRTYPKPAPIGQENP
jgi:oligogalacturonide lyase